jgi:putative transposase
MPGSAAKVIITERQQEALRTMTRSRTGSQALAQRARMILLAFDGLTNEQIAERIGCERHAVGPWRRRWAEAFARLILVECCEKPSALPRAIEELLGDLPRSGSPGKFTAEQVTQILAVACEPPEDSGRPVTHWTPRELADEVIKRRIVESISPRQVGRFLKDGRPATASSPLLAQRPAGRPGRVPAAGRSGLRLLPGGSPTPGDRRDSYGECR